jgi:hypothetical protein
MQSFDFEVWGLNVPDVRPILLKYGSKDCAISGRTSLVAHRVLVFLPPVEFQHTTERGATSQSSEPTPADDVF